MRTTYPLSQPARRLLSTRRELLSKSHVPEGWPAGPATRFSRLKESTLVPRACDREIQSLIRPSFSSSPRAVILDGPRGVGKSAAMLRAVCSARERGAVAMYIPSAREWTHGGGFFSAAFVSGKDMVTDGPASVRYYDRPTQTLQTLSGLLECHGETLEGLPCTIESPLRESNEGELRTVKDVVQFGVDALRDVDADWRANPQLGGDAFLLAVRELSLQKVVPFLLAIDDFDSFVGMTGLISGNARAVHSCGIRIVGELFGRDSLARTVADLRHGVALLAVSKSHGRPKWRKSRVLGSQDYPVSDDVRNDPTGNAWLANVRAMSLRTAAAGISVPADPNVLLDEDTRLDPTAVSAASLAAAGVRFFDIPEWTAAEADMVIADFTESGKMECVEPVHRHRLRELAGGRADILHKVCIGY